MAEAGRCPNEKNNKKCYSRLQAPAYEGLMVLLGCKHSRKKSIMSSLNS